MNEPEDQQQYQGSDGRVDDRRNDARTEMDAELRQQPAADDSAYDSDNEVADKPEPAPAMPAMPGGGGMGGMGGMGMM